MLRHRSVKGTPIALGSDASGDARRRRFFEHESTTFVRLWRGSHVASPTEARLARLEHPTLGSLFYDMMSLLIPDVPHVIVVFGTVDPLKSGAAG